MCVKRGDSYILFHGRCTASISDCRQITFVNMFLGSFPMFTFIVLFLTHDWFSNTFNTYISSIVNVPFVLTYHKSEDV
jgi:hypothetical protein